MRRAQRTESRGGFTLIELIVVILIILILAGLIGAGVLKFMALAPQLQTTNEISQLAVACEAFKTKYKVYPPSAMLLSNNPKSYQLNATTQAYYTYLTAIWPRIDITLTNWGNGGTDIILEGDQCLVFFLQGPGGTSGGVGFSTNPQNPTLAPQAAQEARAGPFFPSFTTSRLRAFAHTAVNNTTALPAFPSFADPYATPAKFSVYAYFSSGRTANGYSFDCPTLAVGPYYQLSGTVPRFYNPNTIQIVSAGADFVFGPGGIPIPPATAPGGGIWPGGPNAKYYLPSNGLPSANANSNTPPNPQGFIGNGFDDLSNFASGFLGVGQ
jgi:prepilin-type N-terminal cleavage/methylation domain-containing protein